MTRTRNTFWTADRVRKFHGDFVEPTTADLVGAAAKGAQAIHEHYERRDKAQRARVRDAMAKAKQEDADFAEYLAAGFTADELEAEFPGAHMRHMNALWRARQAR